jgi:2-polyprenyl-3-methyl-5-hydroxy-6-metoxy-1,4-benzoquinol methylase
VTSESLAVDFPRCIEREFPSEFPLAWSAVERTIASTCVAGADFTPLERRSPALKGYDWPTYLRCSVARMVRVLAALRGRGVTSGRVLDFGAYFGNFSLMLAAAGYEVDAIDAYGEYAPALDGARAAMQDAGVHVLDFAGVGFDLAPLAGRYDAMLCMGVIEHVPHSPKPVFDAARSALTRGGWLLLDTPNLAYLYTRERLSRGESIFAPIALQYHTDRPFEGHHREFVAGEVEWMLNESGFAESAVVTFNYSMYGLPSLAGEDLRKHRQMERDAALREVIFAAARKA